MSAALAAAALLAVGGVGVVLRLDPAEAPEPRQRLVGQVLDEQGRAVTGASVDLGDGVVVQGDGEGRFTGSVRGGPRLVTATAPGHLPRTQAGQPAGDPLDVRLTAQPEATVSLRFGGDVMFGRRYLDRDEDGDRSDGALRPGATAADHAALLRHVQPLLADADLTVVNLETPLREEPWVDPTAPRPASFHPTKEFVFASAPESAQALLDVGVDVVSLGNNHVADALGPGLASTIEVLDRAGLPHFGAGRDEDEAWRPAVLERKGQRVAYLGCTTITGTEHAIPYVADASRPGAARCTRARLDREVRAARGLADLVVVMVHGGEEYEAEQTALVRELSSTAVAAGAALVVDGHPHVVGSVARQGSAVVAETLGNLLFDQTVWPTFLSYLLRVDVRAGAPVLSTVDPLLLEGEVPRPTVGVLADAAGRRAASAADGGPLLQGPGALLAAARSAPQGVARTEQLAPGSVRRLGAGWWVRGLPAGSRTVVGEDLLWTGSFEDLDTDPQTPGAHQWLLGPSVVRTPAAACRGGAGVELRRSPASTRDVVLTPTHRQLVRTGSALSLLVDVRGASAGATVELALFGDTRGPSLSTLSVPVPQGSPGDGPCRRVRLDALVPPGVIAVQPFVRLPARRDDVRAADLSVDDVRLVAWAPPGSTGRQHGVVDAPDGGAVEVVSDRGGSGAPFVD